MKKMLGNYTTVFFVLAIVSLLTIRLPAGMVNAAVIISMSLSMMTLVTMMVVREPLEFSIFSSLLLITAPFGPGISVLTTRDILTDRGASDLVIKALDDFVPCRSVMVGLIILLIIVLMQFIVITEGTKRVTEIVARSNPDAIPGRQMVIDADLGSDLIDERQIKKRREKMQREADFYGTMDDATKVAKDDAVISFITTTINLTGGSVTGYIQSGDSIGNVLNTCPIVTMGDGLVGQTPALLISTTTGMTVTRTVSEGSLNEGVSKQFLAQSRAIVIGGVAAVALAVIPGMPVVQLALISAGLLSGGYHLIKRIKGESSLMTKSVYQDAEVVIPEEATHREAVVSGNAAEEYYRGVNNMHTPLTVEPVEIEFRYSPILLAGESIGGRLIGRIVISRRQYTQSMGFVIPSTHLRDSSGLNTNQYCIKIEGEEVARREIPVGYYLVLEPDQLEREVDGVGTMELAYGIPNRWIRFKGRKEAELYGYTVIDPPSVMVTHLSEVIKQHVYELMVRQEVVYLVENTRKTAPELVEETFPSFASYNLFQRILISLLKEGVPTKDLETIMETMIGIIFGTGLPIKGTDSIVERIKIASERTITRIYYEDGTVKVVTLDSELERIMVGSLSKEEGRYYLALNPNILQNIIGRTAEQLRKFNGLAQSSIVPTSQAMRVYFYRLVEQFYPSVRVPSFNEIASNIQMQSIDGLRLEAPVRRRV